MSKAVSKFEVRGVDKSANAFSSIQSRAAATSAQIRSMVGGAIAAAGAYLGFRAIKGGVDELGRLSDVAQRANVSVDDLTQTSAAMNALGIMGMDVNGLAKAFDYMAKTTGRSGMAGFYQTITEIGKIEDVSQRAQMAMKVFGKSGMSFMPLLNGVDDSIDALQTVVNAMPKIPQAAADSGDAVADAMGFASNQMKSIWLQGLGAVCGWFDNEYAGGVREASLTAGNYMEYYARMAVTKCLAWYSKIQEYLKRYGDFWGTLIGAKMGGASFREAFAAAGKAYTDAIVEYNDAAQEIEEKETERTERFKREFEQRQIAIEHFSAAYDKAAITIDKRNANRRADGFNVGGVEAKSANKLVEAGTYEAFRMQVLGPTYKTDTARQLSLLSKIADNTEKTVDEIGKVQTGDSLDLEVID